MATLLSRYLRWGNNGCRAFGRWDGGVYTVHGGHICCRGACSGCHVMLWCCDTLGCHVNWLQGQDGVVSRWGCWLWVHHRQWWVQGLVRMPDCIHVFNHSGAIVNKSGDGVRQLINIGYPVEWHWLTMSHIILVWLCACHTWQGFTFGIPIGVGAGKWTSATVQVVHIGCCDWGHG